MRSAKGRGFFVGAVLIFCICMVGGFYVSPLWAQEDVSAEINDLNQDIKTKQEDIDYLNQKIEAYSQKIRQKESEKVSIQNEMELLENRMAKAKLDIEATNEEIDLVNTQIVLLEKQLTVLEQQWEDQKMVLKEVLQSMQVQDNKLSLEVYFGSQSFSDIFDHLRYLEDMNRDLKDSLEATQTSKNQVVSAKTIQQTKREQLDQLGEDLVQQFVALEKESYAKDSLLLATARSETQFQELLKEVQQEQQYLNYEVSLLQKEMESRITQNDEYGDNTVLSWPVDPVRGLSATFHDPTYPFRHLFEHSGIDIPAGQGTPLKAAAPGYVAWTRLGNMYGNYVMIIHANGIATLYAHMSGIEVTADQFVSRGDIIGYTGGMPGTQGAGLSTGPHLHFEVRLNGIPVDPMTYLLSY
ncbi:MAG: Peptidase M23 [Candidatus Uhrbacteria bacterium GW2011_GWE2_46_68]|uniref:Peptidase M23 n=2 Tax=Candidatus Uhriibacteriota TaxID=1752732 RepID=A0A0G1SFZ8_9BACT|nr:MAG: Peptidase M23 [Candidatus Uhrbacteria bacterium GW2011_GWF2_46_218]KKU40998.1 MAG: Peptidase M23 [Candidatus Uhrbacteria bacterium GW2011_GWE2_46_68]